MDRRDKAAERREDPGLKAAIKAIGVTGIAKACEITAASVSGWDQIPPERVAAVSRDSGLPKYILLPDLYDAPANAGAAA